MFLLGTFLLAGLYCSIFVGCWVVGLVRLLDGWVGGG